MFLSSSNSSARAGQSGGNYSPSQIADNGRLEFINMLDSGQKNFVFEVDELTGQVYQYPIDENGEFGDRIEVSNGVQYTDASGNTSNLPGMYDSDGQLVPFNDYYIGEDGYLYGNVDTVGADPANIHDQINSTWVKLGSADQFSNLPEGVSFAVIVNLSGEKSIGIKQDHAVEPPFNTQTNIGAVFDPSIGNIPFKLGSVELKDSVTGATDSYILPMDINNGQEPKAFDEYRFLEVDGELRLYVVDGEYIYDLGKVPDDFYGNDTLFEDGDVLVGPNGDGAGSGESGERVNKKYSGDFANVLDASNTVADTGKGNDTVHVTELGLAEDGEPLKYYVDLGKRNKDTLYLYGSRDDWKEVDIQTVNVNGHSYNRKFVHEDTGTEVYVNASTNRIDYFSDENYETFDFSELKTEGNLKYSGDLARILDASNIEVDTGKGNDSVHVVEVGWDENGEPLEYYAHLGGGNGDTLYLYGVEDDWERVPVEPFKAHGNKYDRKYVHKETGTVVYFNAKADNVEFFTD